MGSITLVIPGLIPNIAEDAIDVEAAKIPGLAFLLTKSKRHDNPDALFQYLLKKFSVAEVDVSFAALSAIGDGLPGEKNYWLRAYPIHLQADLQAVYAIGQQGFDFNDEQLMEYKDALQPLFSQVEARLHLPNSTRWYLESLKPINITTHPFIDIIGKDIFPFLPTGTDARQWQQLMTETQMYFHEQSTLISGLWFWGEGHLPQQKPHAINKVFSDEPLSLGLAKYFDLDCGSLDGVINAKDLSDSIIVTEQLSQSLNTDDISNWWDNLYELDRKLFQPIQHAYEAKLITNIEIYSDEHHCYHLTKMSWWPFGYNKLTESFPWIKL